MESKKFFINVRGKAISYSQEGSITLEQTNLPSDAMTFSFGPGIFWEIEVLNFDEELKLLKLKVVDFEPKETQTFYEQNLQINFMEFDQKFDWDLLRPYLSFHQEIELEQFIIKRPPEAHPKLKSAQEYALDFKDFYKQFPEIDELAGPYIIRENFEYLFSKVTFHEGHVTLSRKFNDYPEKIEIRIFNRREFLDALHRGSLL